MRSFQVEIRDNHEYLEGFMKKFDLSFGLYLMKGFHVLKEAL